MAWHIISRGFQSTLPRRERRRRLYRSQQCKKISIHAPTKRATAHIIYELTSIRDFNPRSHEGSDGTYGEFCMDDTISIHAPTKGATIWVIYRKLILWNFNPRSHEGSDQDRCCHYQIHSTISIHAPTKGATSSGIASSTSFFIFQSTLPRRERRNISVCMSIFQNFNPRSHEGSDVSVSASRVIFRQFQSTLPRRERLFRNCFFHIFFHISIHAPTKGATC